VAFFNPDLAVEIVMRAESSIKTGIPVRFFFESVATPTMRRKIEEMLTNADLAVPVFAGISARNRFSIAKSGFNRANGQSIALWLGLQRFAKLFLPLTKKNSTKY
jgi:hypothetical protein